MIGMDLLRRTMDVDAFWQLIAVMDGRADEDAVQRLRTALEERGTRDARRFAERLARALHELDREVLFRQPVRFDDEEPGVLEDAEHEPIPLSDDSFLYLRAGIVAQGRSTYEQVLADPETLARGTWPECEELLYVADEVVGDEIDAKVSYETGSNRRYWGSVPTEPAREAWDVGPRAVWADVRDMSDPLEGEVHHADGRVEPTTEYLPPLWLPRTLLDELTLAPSRLVTTGGGLPRECGSQLQVRIDLGDGWGGSPRDDGLHAEPDMISGQVRRITTSVDRVTVRGWDARVRREALLGLVAAAVLEVLPDDHAAQPALQDLADRGAGHLPVTT